MTAFLYKFSTTQTNQTAAFNQLNNEIRQGFNALYPSFGSALQGAINAVLFDTPISVGLDVDDFNQQRPQDTGIMAFSYVWGEFGPVPDINSPDPGNPDFIQISTPGFWCDLICDLGGTTVDPVWFQNTVQARWDRGKSTKRQTTPEQRSANGGKAEIDFVDTGSSQVLLCAPEFAKHGFAGVINTPLTGTPKPDADTKEKPGKRRINFDG